MKKVLLSMFLVLILSGCSIDWNWEKDQKIVKLEKQIQNDTFNKNKECIKLEPEMRKQLESNERYGNMTPWNTLYLSEVFYSPLKNTCLYKSEFIFWNTYKLEINDYFTKNILFEKICLSWENNLKWFSECSDEFKNKIKELKWE